MSWRNVKTESGDIHTIPQGEDHDLSVSCWCEPRAEPVEGVLCVVHNSGDGREAVEWAEHILS